MAEDDLRLAVLMAVPRTNRLRYGVGTVAWAMFEYALSTELLSTEVVT